MQSTTVSELMELAQSKSYDTLLDRYQNDSIESVAQVADFLRDRDCFNVALPLYLHLLQQRPIPDFYNGVGQCYGKLYQYGTALIYLQKTFELQPDRLDGTHYYAYILERNFLMEQAQQWYEKAIATIYGDDLWTLSHYAYFLEKFNQPEAAERAYQDVLTRNPTYTWAMKRYALFLLKHDPERSRRMMQSAIELYPKNPFVQLNYLEYLIIQGNEEAYDAQVRSLDYDHLVLPFQTLIDLFNYFQHFLLQHRSDPAKLTAYKEKVQMLKDSIHRDFDDLNELLTANNGDLTTWQQMTRQLVV